MLAPLLPGSLWLILKPLLPPPRTKPKGGRPPVPARAALTGILFVLRTGIPWEMLPAEMGCGSGVTCWRRLRDWQEAGLWDRACTATAATAARCGPDRLEPRLRRQLLHRRQKGGAATGPNPTDRGRPGTERHLIADRRGVPLAFLLTGANVHDSVPFKDLLDAVPPVAGKRGRPRRRPDKLHADKAYDHRRCRRACNRRRIKPRIARRGVETSRKLGRHRRVVERSFARLNKFRRPTIRYERRIDIHNAFTSVACSLIPCGLWRRGFERRSKAAAL